ncbi:MAG: hypothetical protein NXI30_03625 [bacterium]|nr:hypothetical protein [bacterium]
MTAEPSPDGLDQAERSRCPVCDAATISNLVRLRLYLGATERCSACMAGWKFTWSRWLYPVPIAATFLIVLGAYSVMSVALDDFAVIAAVSLAALVAPLLLPIEARVGDRLTDHAIRRHARREAEEGEPAAPSVGPD